MFLQKPNVYIGSSAKALEAIKNYFMFLQKPNVYIGSSAKALFVIKLFRKYRSQMFT